MTTYYVTYPFCTTVHYMSRVVFELKIALKGKNIEVVFGLLGPIRLNQQMGKVTSTSWFPLWVVNDESEIIIVNIMKTAYSLKFNT
jgi:hypothetical protein